MAQRCIGVDVGGTKVSVATHQGGGLSEPTLRPTALTSTRALLDQLGSAISEAAAGDADALVGVGVPSVVDWASGRVRSSVNVPLTDVALADELGQRTGLRVVVDNDASVAALAEACDDVGRVVVDSLALLTVGTGVGGGLILGGRVHRGATGGAAEFGHIPVAAPLAPGPPHTTPRFPQPGALEQVAAGRVLDHLAIDRGYRDGPDCVRAAQAGDPPAVDALAILGSRLALGVAALINALEPQEIRIGGGVSAAGDLLLGPLLETAWPWVLTGVGTQTTIGLAKHGPKAGVLGAALLALHELGRTAPTPA